MDPTKFHILIVEDEDELREMIAEELGDAGYTTRQASNGAEGLEAILEDPPDLVLCDITMPKMNGHELLTEVRQAQTSVGEVDFVFLSALADKGQVLEGLRLGADDYLTKPIDFDLLLVKVEGRIREIERRRGVREHQLAKLYKALSPKEDGATGSGGAQIPQAPVTQAGDGRGSPSVQSLSSQIANPEQFKRGLAQIAQDNAGQVVAGQIQVIGLDGLKSRLGERWPRLAEQVKQTAERTIRSRLAPQDVLTRNSDGGFVICFAQLSEGAAALKAQALSEEIWNKLLGEVPEAEALTMVAEVHTLDIPPAEIEQAEDLLSIVMSCLGDMAEQVKGREKATLAELYETAKIEHLPVWTSSGSVAPLVIATFDPRSKSNIDHIALAKGDAKEILADVDILTLGKVCEQIYRSLDKDKKMIAVPVSYQTIRSPKLAKKFFHICDGLLPAVRDRLIFIVRDVPQNLLNSDQSIARLSAYSKFRMVHLDSAALCSVDLQKLRVNLVCISYGTLVPHLRDNRSGVMDLVRRIRESKARVLLCDIPRGAEYEMSKEVVDFLSFQNSRTT